MAAEYWGERSREQIISDGMEATEDACHVGNSSGSCGKHGNSGSRAPAG